jgi:hypothetical protein
LSFQVSVSGVTLVNFMASCAIAELANAIKAAATKNLFMLTSSQMDVACQAKLHQQIVYGTAFQTEPLPTPPS